MRDEEDEFSPVLDEENEGFEEEDEEEEYEAF